MLVRKTFCAMAQDLILAVPAVLVTIDKSIPSKQTFISGFRRNVDEIALFWDITRYRYVVPKRR